MYVYHGFNLRDRIFPKLSTTYNKTKPVLQSPNECSKDLPKKLFKRYHLFATAAIEISQKVPHVAHKIINKDQHLPAAISKLSAALEPLYANRHRIAMTAMAPHQENPFAFLEKILDIQNSPT